MKRLLLIPILFLAGCAITPNVQQIIGSPQQVQAEVAALGAIAHPYVPSRDVAQVHNFANALATCTAINSTILLGLIPAAHNPPTRTDALISASAAFVSLALSRYSQSDPQTVAYAHAVGNGLLVSFP